MKKEQYPLITYLLFFVVTATVVSVLYKRNQQLEEYDLIQHKLEQLKELDARIDRDLLLNLSFYSSNYDALAQSSTRIDTLQHEITEQTARFSQEVPEFKTVLQQYIQNSTRKERHLERIKSLSSSIKNTLQYLPTVINELSHKITASRHDPEDLRFKINQLFGVLLDYNIFPRHDKKQILEEKIAELEGLSDHVYQKDLNNILSHIQANLRMKNQMENMLRTYE